MKHILDQTWNYRIFTSELCGAILMMFLTFLAFYLVVKKGRNERTLAGGFLAATALAIPIIFSILFARGLAALLGKPDEGLGLLNPGIILIVAFKYQVFSSLWYLLIANFLGSIIGMALFLAFISINGERKFEQFLFQSDLKMTKFITKEITFISLFFISATFIAAVPANQVGGNEIFLICLMILAILMIIAFSSFFGFYMFALNISFVSFLTLVLVSLRQKNAQTAHFLQKQTLYISVQTVTHVSLAITFGAIAHALVQQNTVGFAA